MVKKSSAYYQREYRKRLREQGLVKKEVWVLPENSKLLLSLEKQLRLPVSAQKQQGDIMSENYSQTWDTLNLFNALSKSSLCDFGRANVELVDGVEPSILVEMTDFGDLPIFITVVGEQIVAEAVLWSTKEVDNLAAFNEAVLKTHKYFPLSTISLDTLSNGDEYYHMFGALSSSSSFENIVFELEVLANNVIQATEAYSNFLNIAVAN